MRKRDPEGMDKRDAIYVGAIDSVKYAGDLTDQPILAMLLVMNFQNVIVPFFVWDICKFNLRQFFDLIRIVNTRLTHNEITAAPLCISQYAVSFRCFLDAKVLFFARQRS